MKQFFVFAYFILLCNCFTEEHFAQTYATPPGPENVLVVYNTQSDTSFMVMDYYKTARGIPGANIVPLDGLSEVSIA